MAIRGDLHECFQRLKDSGAPIDLVELVTACLATEPQQRPRDAGVVAQRLTTHLESVAKQLKRAEVRRKLAYVIAASLVLFVTALGSGGVWLQAKETEAANQVATAQQKRADEQQAANEELQQVLYASEIQLASTKLSIGNVKDAVTILDSHVPESGETDRRGFEWHFLKRLCLTPKTVGRVNWRPESVDVDEISRDWDRVVKVSVIERGEQETRYRVAVTNPQTEREIWSTEVKRPTLEGPSRGHVTISPSGTKVSFFVRRPARNEEPVPIDIWDVNSGQHHVIKVPELVSVGVLSRGAMWRIINPSFSPEGRFIAVQIPRGNPAKTTLVVWEIGSPKPIHATELEQEWRARHNPVFSPDGSKIVLLSDSFEVDRSKVPGDYTGLLQIIETTTGKELARDTLEKFQMVYQGTFSPDGSLFAASGANRSNSEFATQGLLWVWDTKTGERHITVNLRPNVNSSSLAFSPDGSVICSTRSGELFDTRTGAWLGKLDGMEKTAFRPFLRYEDDGRSILAAVNDGELMKWPVPAPKYDDPAFRRAGIPFASPDGTLSARVTATGIRSLMGWSAKRVALFGVDGSHRMLELPRGVYASWGDQLGAFSHDCRFLGLVTEPVGQGDDEGQRVDRADEAPELEVTLWDVETGEFKGTVWNPSQHEQIIRLVDVPDSRFMAGVIQHRLSGQPATHRLMIWDLASLSTKATVEFSHIKSIVFSPDAETVAIETGEKNDSQSQLVVCRVEDGKKLRQFPIRSTDGGRSLRGSHVRNKLAFRTDGNAIAVSAIETNCIDLWDVQTGKKLQTLQLEEEGSVFAWSKSGDRIIAFDQTLSGERQGELKVWDARNGRKLLVHAYYGLGRGKLRWLPDREQLITWPANGPPKVWDATPMDNE